MCQMSVVLDQDGKQERIMDAVARLEVTDKGVIISALFETPITVDGATVREIDFLDGVVVLARKAG